MNQALFALATSGETSVQLFWVCYSGGEIAVQELQNLAAVLSDSVDQEFWINPSDDQWKQLNFEQLQVVYYKTGVTDNAAAAFHQLLSFQAFFAGRALDIHSGIAYLIRKPAKKNSVNPLIQGEIVFQSSGPISEALNQRPLLSPELKRAEVEQIRLQGLSGDELSRLSQARFWALSEIEMRAIQTHFGDKSATDVELEVIAQTWSEHCKHKIFAANIQYQDQKQSLRIESLFKTFIQNPTSEIQKTKKWAISVFKDNAGIVRFHDDVDLCIKVETHNSPSALDPYGGALTGILGVNRDILGTGLGAKPIANTNVLLFGQPDETEELPRGLFHPLEVLRGVHRGIQDGGNKSGIPTVNGAMLFDDSFAGKPLVFCGTVGVLPQAINGISSASKNQKSGDWIVMVGGAVGYDGIHGATSSSLALDENTPSTMVQIGDPLTQKRVIDFMLEARDLGLYNSVTDNGAGGLSSSIGEMASETGGAKVFLDQVPLKYPGLSPWQIFISESQERMTLSVAKDQWLALQSLAARRGVLANIVGEFTHSGMLEIFHHHQEVGRLDLNFLHHGNPRLELKANWSGPRKRETWKKVARERAPLPGIREILYRLAQDPSLASKEKWIRQYDQEVQGASVTKPFESGPNSAPNDGAVIWMGAHGNSGFSGAVVSSGICPDFSLIDPYFMAQIAADEAVRNAIVTGADPNKIALIDNFCWPDPTPGANNPDAEQKLGELVRTCSGLSELVLAYGMPLISGKDSMKNDFAGSFGDGRAVKISVLPTLLVTALAYHPDVRQVIKPHAKPGEFIYLLNPSPQAPYYGTSLPKYFNFESSSEVKFDLAKTRKFYESFYRSTRLNLIAAAHDLSEGGLAFALFEMMMRTGAGLSLAMESNEVSYLFGEAPGRIIVSVTADKRADFELHFSEDERVLLGQADQSGALRFMKPSGVEEINLGELTQVWRNIL